MTTISVRGTITTSDDAWLYDWLGLACTTPEQFKAQLEAAEDDVVVEINSPGGVVLAASEIYEAIRSYAGNIECRVVGQAASAASVIACAAKSSITPMGTLFLHNCIGAAQGNHNAMREAAQAMESVDENIMNAYRAKTGMTDSQIYRLMERNTTISATKAVELGFIDRITESAADVLQANSGVVSGVAAGAPGFIDPMAIDADRLAAMRKLYEQSKASCEGGETTMEIEDIEIAVFAAFQIPSWYNSGQKKGLLPGLFFFFWLFFSALCSLIYKANGIFLRKKDRPLLAYSNGLTLRVATVGPLVYAAFQLPSWYTNIDTANIYHTE